MSGVPASSRGATFNGGTISPSTDPGLTVQVPETVSQAIAVKDTTTGNVTWEVDPFGGFLGTYGTLSGDNSAAGTTVLGVHGATLAQSFFDYFQVIGGSGEQLLRVVAGGGVLMPSLPAADPHVAGQLWNSAGTLHVSAG